MTGRRHVRLVALAALLLTALHAPATQAGEPVASSATFRMPSRNVGCTYFAPTLRCDIRSGLVPAPRARCELDWTGLSVSGRGRAQPTCAGDTAYDPRAPILAYGRTWRRDGITNRSLRTGIHCANRSGRGFDLARGFWLLF